MTGACGKEGVVDQYSMNRRQFLRAGVLTLGALTAAACASAEEVVVAPQPIAMPVERPILPSPVPQPTLAVEDIPLARFMALSALLTGYEPLNPVLAQVYFTSLQGQELPIAPEEMFALAGLDGEQAPTTLEELEQGGFFDNEAANEVANTILTYWYTGIYDTGPEEQAVATYVDSLTWRAIAYTKPLTICGAPGFWAEAPIVRSA